MLELINRLERFANETPSKIAYSIDSESITYSELFCSVKYYADLLKRQGTSPVMLIGHKQVSFLVAMLACIGASRAYIPVDTGTPKERIEKIFNITGTNLVLTFDKTNSFDTFSAVTLKSLEKFSREPLQSSGNTTAYIIFTSGSTGNPKGVPISYKNLDNFMKWISRIEPLNGYEDITVLNQALFSFDLSVADIYYSLFNGHTLAALEHQDLGSFSYVFDTFNQKKPNVMVVTPTFVRLCLTDKSFCQERFPFLRCIYFCGEVLEPTTVRKLFVRFPNLKILNAYGPTEATSAVSAVLITPKIAEESENLPVGSLGDFATEIEIIDGEIVLKGKSVFHGYLGGEVGGYFEENGIDCYCTGDNGKIENGMLYCLGRSDRQIKVNGYRVELDEIERHIDSVKGVTACGVVASYTSNGKLRCINAFVCGEGINEQQIRNKLKSSLPPYMIPKNIKIVDKLAVNRNGKIDRRALIENEKC